MQSIKPIKWLYNSVLRMVLSAFFAVFRCKNCPGEHSWTPTEFQVLSNGKAFHCPPDPWSELKRYQRLLRMWNMDEFTLFKYCCLPIITSEECNSSKNAHSWAKNNRLWLLWWAVKTIFIYFQSASHTKDSSLSYYLKRSENYYMIRQQRWNWL